MKIYLSNSDYLGNFNAFLSRLDLSDDSKLLIKTHPKWINVHPAVLAFVATLALKVGEENVIIPDLTASSGLYLDRMGLFNYTTQKSPYNFNEKDPAGRFIPLTTIKTPADQSKFITDIIPLLHLPPAKTDAIKYVIGELTYEEMVHGLEIAIHQFAKRQMTWFRGMERRGFTIHWINAALTMEEKLDKIEELLR